MITTEPYRHRIIAKCDLLGHLRSGIYDLALTEEEFAEYSSLDQYEQREFIKHNAKLTVWDYEIDDVEIYSIEDVQTPNFAIKDNEEL